MSSRSVRFLQLSPNETLATLAKRYPHSAIRWRCARLVRAYTNAPHRNDNASGI